MTLDDWVCDAVFRSAYGLAKGHAGVSVKIANILNGTGLEESEVAEAIDLLVRSDRIIAGPEAGRVSLTRFGLTVAKANVENNSTVVFAD